MKKQMIKTLTDATVRKYDEAFLSQHVPVVNIEYSDLAGSRKD